MLKNHSDAVRWLINMKLLWKRERWTDETFTYLIERLWNTECKATVSQWLVSTASLKLPDFEVKFIEKFGDSGMDQVLTEMTTSIQGEEETCEEFMDRVMFVARLLQVWDPSVLPSDDFLMAGLTSIEVSVTKDEGRIG